MAELILADAAERKDNNDLYRWAKLVVERNQAGRSLANADDWLGAIMAGLDPEGLE
jgi:hypothetical protein